MASEISKYQKLVFDNVKKVGQNNITMRFCSVAEMPRATDLVHQMTKNVIVWYKPPKILHHLWFYRWSFPPIMNHKCLIFYLSTESQYDNLIILCSQSLSQCFPNILASDSGKWRRGFTVVSHHSTWLWYGHELSLKTLKTNWRKQIIIPSQFKLFLLKLKNDLIWTQKFLLGSGENFGHNSDWHMRD